MQTYAEISKWGRLRPPPVAEEGSKKEWPRSKFCEANSEQKISGTRAGHNGADSKHSRVCHLPFSVNPLFIGFFWTLVWIFIILHLAVFSQFGIKALTLQFNTETYRSGHNGADSKSVCEQSHVSSNLTVSAKDSLKVLSFKEFFFFVGGVGRRE